MQSILEGCSANAAAHIERECFERAVAWVSDYLDAGRGRFGAYLVAVEDTVPRSVMLDALTVWGDRAAFIRPGGAAGLPYGYWSDLIIFPVRRNCGQTEFLMNRSHILCVTVPIVTVERRVLGIIGEKRTAVCCDLSGALNSAMREIGQCRFRAQGYRYCALDGTEQRRFAFEAICQAKLPRAASGARP